MLHSTHFIHHGLWNINGLCVYHTWRVWNGNHVQNTDKQQPLVSHSKACSAVPKVYYSAKGLLAQTIPLMHKLHQHLIMMATCPAAPHAEHTNVDFWIWHHMPQHHSKKAFNTMPSPQGEGNPLKAHIVQDKQELEGVVTEICISQTAWFGIAQRWQQGSPSMVYYKQDTESISLVDNAAKAIAQIQTRHTVNQTKCSAQQEDERCDKVDHKHNTLHYLTTKREQKGQPRLKSQYTWGHSNWSITSCVKTAFYEI